MVEKIWTLLPHRDFPGFRLLHIAIAALILSQIINSNMTSKDALEQPGMDNIVTWFHIISGLSLIILGTVLLSWMLLKRGIRYYYSWLFMDFTGIKEDVRTLRERSLPDAHSGGIASTVQGLGVLALLGVALSGASWFVSDYFYLFSGVNSEMMIGLHKFLTSFIEIYFFAHGAMGLLHMIMSYFSPLRTE